MIGVLGVRRRAGQRRRQADVGGNDLVDERVERRSADRLQHALEVVAARAQVSGLKRIGHGYFAEGAIAPRRRAARRPRPARSVAAGSSRSRAAWRSRPRDDSPGRALTATTSPDTGENSSDTALTDSMLPNTSPCWTCRPTSGSSTNTTSPSWRWAKSVMPDRRLAALRGAPIRGLSCTSTRLGYMLVLVSRRRFVAQARA